MDTLGHVLGWLFTSTIIGAFFVLAGGIMLLPATLIYALIKALVF